MFKIAPVDQPVQKRGLFYYARVFIYKTSGILEVLAILLLWLIIFTNKSVLGGFTRQEIITYIIAGNLIGLISGYFLHRIIASDIYGQNSKLLVYKPIKYFFLILPKGFGRNFLPFIIAVIYHLLVLYFFLDYIVINFNILYLSVITAMIVLAFIIEFLLAYLLNLFVFWTLEAKGPYKILIRLKNFLAGAYFPLSLLPPVFVSVGLVLPFAYSFFVPMELYLKKIDLATGLRGMIVQLIWIGVIYALIQLTWSRQIKKKLEKQK